MDGAIWVLILALILFATILLIHHFIDVNLPLTRLPVTWFYASWLIGLFLLSMPIFKYFESFDAINGAYVVGILFAYSVGSVSAAFWGRRSKAKILSSQLSIENQSLPKISAKFLFVLLALGLVGTSMLMLNTVLGGSLSLADRLDSENFSAIRLEHMISTESRIGIFFGPATLMSSIGGLGVAFFFYLRGSRSEAFSGLKGMYGMALLVLAINIIIGLVGFGSRMFAVFSILVAFLAFVEGRWSIGEHLILKRISLKGFIVISFSTIATLVILWFAATLFLEKRVQNQDPQSLLFRTHRASFAPTVYALTRDDKAAQYFMFSLSYLTTPIPTLTFYLDLPESRQPGPFFGEYNFPAIARWLRRLTFSGNPYSWDSARVDIFKPLGDIGFGTNVWATLVRDLIADFTKIGALIFLSVFGFFTQRVFDRQQESPSVRLAGLMVYLRLILIFAGMISILFMPQVHWSFYLAIFVVAFARKKMKKSQILPRPLSQIMTIKR